MRRLLGGLPRGQPFGTFAGTAAVAVGVAPAAVVAVDVAAAAVVAQGCSIHASQPPCSAAVAPAKRAERRSGSGGSCCRKGVSHHVFSWVS